MKILVDEMPVNQSKCPFSEWRPYPPFVETPGYYKCSLSLKDCDLSAVKMSYGCEEGCSVLKIIKE